MKNSQVYKSMDNKQASCISTDNLMYLINMYEHHESVAFARGILFLFQECMNQLWCIRNKEVKVPEEQFPD